LAKRTLHIIVTISLLFSITDINRISLMITASFADNDCPALFCTCSGSCSCSGGAHENASVNAAGIPILIPQNDDETQSSCCTKPETEASKEHADNAVHSTGPSICSCGHETPPEAEFLLKPLDKVTLFPQPDFNQFTTPHSCNCGRIYEVLPPHTDEVFHPPSWSAFGLSA